MSGQLHAPAALLSEYPLDRSPRTGLNGDQKNLSTGIEPRLLGRSVRRLVAIPTELSRLPTKNTQQL
jgi:hypothetical protein